MKNFSSRRNGFVFIEVVVVLGILTTLLAIVIINVGNFRSKTAANMVVDVFVSDVKSQQTKAMIGDTEGRSVTDSYGIYIQPDAYTLFSGQQFVSSSSSNFVVSIDDAYELTTTFLYNSIRFASGSGEIINFAASMSAVTVRNKDTLEQKTIHFNKYGSITEIE